MEEKNILRISIIGRYADEIDVRCDLDARFNKLIAQIIVGEMQTWPEFRECMLNELNKL